MAIGLLGSLLGCSSSDAGTAQDQTAQCKSIAVTECKKIWECEPAGSLSASQFGAGEASCETLWSKDCGNPMPCQDGYTWDFANGDECIKEFGALTCDQYTTLTKPLTACDDACKLK